MLILNPKFLVELNECNNNLKSVFNYFKFINNFIAYPSTCIILFKLVKIKKISLEQLRILKQEQQVEEIVKEKTLKTFNERCRQYFKMDSF